MSVTERTFIRFLALAGTLLLSSWTHVQAEQGEETAAASGPASTGPWIEALQIYLAPTMARLHGDGYPPGATLWIDVTDPLGSVFTEQVAVDADGRVMADLPVDEPGVHETRIRDVAGQVLSTGELLVGLQ